MALRKFDPEIWDLCVQEKERQIYGLEMIASENFTSQSVLEALSSSFHNKYSEGKVGARYYGGNQFVDAMESLCQKRALKLFKLNPDEWGVNVQPYSGSPANMEVYTALAGIHGRIMGLDLPDGGHLTHGFQAPSGKKVSASSLFFESMPYKVDPTSGLIDYDQLEATARLFRPKIIIAGTSAYSRLLDYGRFRAIADSVSAVLMADMAHISGLVATGLHPSPFLWCDVVTTTTHKTLRGPRGAMIFYRKFHTKPGRSLSSAGAKATNQGLANGGAKGDVAEAPAQLVATDYDTRVNEAVFPGMQGGPHNHTICALAVALKEAASPEFKEYQLQVLANMQQLCSSLLGYGYYIVSGGSDTHVCLVDLRTFKYGEPLKDGGLAEKVLEMAGITVNKNTVPGDVSALRPSGIRLGTPALTSRGMQQLEMVEVASLIHRALQLAKVAQTKAGQRKKVDEVLKLFSEDEELCQPMKNLAEDVRILASRYPLPGMPDY